MQIAQAFQQAVSALSWPIDNLSHVAEWRASVERILGLQAGIARAKILDKCEDCVRIQISGSEDAKLSFRDVSIFNPAGEIVVDHLTAEIEPGQRIWLYGEPPSTIAVAKVLTGLWTSGRGRVDMPNNGPLYFMPQIPYLPLAPLREVVAYPVAPGAEHEEKIRHSLWQAGLPQLIEKLSDTEIWEEILSLGEQQRLGFARLLFHRPRWIILEQPADALNEAGQREMMHLLETEFPAAAMVFIGDSEPASRGWGRIVLGAASLAKAPVMS
jgi:putative ATP-binding cassette transporter